MKADLMASKKTGVIICCFYSGKNTKGKKSKKINSEKQIEVKKQEREKKKGVENSF